MKHVAFHVKRVTYHIIHVAFHVKKVIYHVTFVADLVDPHRSATEPSQIPGPKVGRRAT